MTTAAERAEILKNFARSGLGPREYATQIGVREHTFASWLCDARAATVRHATSTPAAGRVRIQVFDPSAARSEPFELRLSSGLILRVPSGFDGPELRRLLSVLDGPC